MFKTRTIVSIFQGLFIYMQVIASESTAQRRKRELLVEGT